jgi:hypothetical protein
MFKWPQVQSGQAHAQARLPGRIGQAFDLGRRAQAAGDQVDAATAQVRLAEHTHGAHLDESRQGVRRATKEGAARDENRRAIVGHKAKPLTDRA